MSYANRLLTYLAPLIFWCVFPAGTDTVLAQPAHTMEQTIEFESEGEVELIAERGTLQIEAWDRSAVEVAVEVEEWASRQDRDPVEIEKEGRKLVVRTTGADPDGAGFWDLIGLGGDPDAPRTHYTLRVPATVSLSVTTQRGSVEVDGIDGESTIEGYSASVTVRDAGGDVTVATFSGDLHAENVRGPLTFATFSGDAWVKGEAPVAEHTFASFSGDAEIVFPADAAFDLRTDVSWGGVSSDFVLPDSTAQADGPVSIGGGGPSVIFESVSGRLTLRAK